ncbi:D-alanine--poly(phosphoribitol) ligase subunit DltA [Fibrobacterota bacterium]
MDLLKSLESIAIRHPGRTVMSNTGGQSLTYGGLWARASLLARWMAEDLPRDNSPVFLIGHKQPSMIVSLVACVMSGHCFVPVDINTPRQRVNNMVKNACPSLIIDMAGMFTEPRENLLHKEQLENLLRTEKGGGAPLDRQVKGTDIFYIIFTSGSTGEPKGVQISRDNLESFVSWTSREYGYPEAQDLVFLNQAPFSFDLSVFELYNCLAHGFSLFCLEKKAIENSKILFDFLFDSSVGITNWVSTPSFAELCLKDPDFNGNRIPFIKEFIFCGEVLLHKTAGDLVERFPAARIYNLYGPTEATCATTSVLITEEILNKYDPLPVGRVKPGTEIKIIPAQSAGDIPDEIHIIGDNVSCGYLNLPELNRERFFSREGVNGYKTGDSGFFRDGFLFFQGRKDIQIKLYGHRIELGDIESNLLSMEEIREAVVLFCDEADSMKYLAAFIIFKDGTLPDDPFSRIKQLKKKVRRVLPEYMLPKRYIFKSHFPLTNNGKVDRKKLAEELV